MGFHGGGWWSYIRYDEERDRPEVSRSLVRRVAKDICRTAGVTFFDEDWRDTHEAGKNIARRMDLYRQQYCGCVYSEHDRYKDTPLHVRRTGV